MGEGVKKVCFCPCSGYKNCPRRGGWVKKWQNSVHVVIECPLKLSCCFFSVKLFGFLKADAGMAGLARLNLNGFLKILTFVSSQAPLIYLTPQFRFLQQVYILATLKFRYCEKPKHMYIKVLPFLAPFHSHIVYVQD